MSPTFKPANNTSLHICNSCINMNKNALNQLLQSIFFTLGAIVFLSLRAQAADPTLIEGAREARSLAFMFYNTGDYSGNCTGYYVKVSRSGQAPDIRFATARHCLSFSKNWSLYPYGPAVRKSDQMQPHADKYKRSFSKSNIVIDGIDHFLEAKSVNITSYYERPSEVPPTGSALRILGYPEGIGPKEFSCMLKGYVMRPKQITNYVENGILGYLVCLGANIQAGISGGPILNARGEVVGTMSAKGSSIIALFSPNYLSELQTIKMWKIVDNKFVEDSEQSMCFSADHRLLPLSKCQ